MSKPSRYPLLLIMIQPPLQVYKKLRVVDNWRLRKEVWGLVNESDCHGDSPFWNVVHVQSTAFRAALAVDCLTPPWTG